LHCQSGEKRFILVRNVGTILAYTARAMPEVFHPGEKRLSWGEKDDNAPPGRKD